MMMERAIPHVFHSQYSAPQTQRRFNLTNPFTTVQPFQYYSETLLPSPPNTPPVHSRFSDSERLVNKSIFVKMKIERNSLFSNFVLDFRALQKYYKRFTF